MTLRIPYRAFRRAGIAPQLLPPGGPTIRYRPVIPIRILVPSSGIGLVVGDAFADPGSDFTVFRHDVVATLGTIAFVHEMNHRWKGIDYSVRFAPVRLELSDDAEKLTWLAAVGFTQAPLPYGCLLGLSGFFEFFDVRFLGSQRILEVDANDLFHQVR